MAKSKNAKNPRAVVATAETAATSANEHRGRLMPRESVEKWFRSGMEFLALQDNKRALRQDVLDAMAIALPPTLEQQSLNNSGSQRWRTHVQFQFTAFKKANFLTRKGGWWTLLPAGEAAIADSKFDLLAASGKAYRDYKKSQLIEDAEAKTWLIATDVNGSKWPMFRYTGCIAVGFEDIAPDSLLGLSKRQIIQIAESRLGDKKSQSINADMLINFSTQMKVGERVVAKSGRDQILGLGVIESDYTFVSGDSWPHQRRVRWMPGTEIDLTEEVHMPQKTLTPIDAEHEVMKAIEASDLIERPDVEKWLGLSEPVVQGQGFSGLVDRFYSEFFTQIEGRTHIALYSEATRSILKNLETVRQAKLNHKPLSPLVFNLLLAHKNTRPSRDQGRWISPAPVITKDLISWFEGAGWHKKNGWEETATALLEMFEGCLANKNNLQASLTTFANRKDSTGFKVGFISATLNALEPKNFPLINSKVRKCCKKLFNVDLAKDLPGYAHACGLLSNEIGNTINPLFSEHRFNGYPVTNLFDTFCHWWVTQGSSAPSASTHPPVLPVYKLQDAVKGLFISDDEFETLRRQAIRKKALILCGPPGTGKSFVAERLAKLLVGHEAESNRVTVQFHAAYGYEDFIEGLRPTPNGSFELRDGIFRRLCIRAIRKSEETFVLVIEEINRGNLAKIFGEALFLIEADKRGSTHAINQTAYSSARKNDVDEQFYIPKNLIILGTMNTADRSLALVDFALRRRFAHENLSSQIASTRYRQYLLGDCKAPEELVDRIQRAVESLNNKIKNTTSLGLEFCVGHSFFVPNMFENSISDDEEWETWVRDVADSEIQPLVFEYLHPDRDEAQGIVDAFRAELGLD